MTDPGHRLEVSKVRFWYTCVMLGRGTHRCAPHEKELILDRVDPCRMRGHMLNDSEMERHEVSRPSVLRAPGLDEGFLIMVGNLVETALALSVCLATGDASQMGRCEALTEDLRESEADLTRRLLAFHEEGNRLKALIHLPFLLVRIGEKLEDILNCCRAKSRDGILFSCDVEAHLQQLLAILADMMSNLRDAFVISDAVLVNSIISEGSELSRMLRDLRSAQWPRQRMAHSAFEATTMYLDILDAIKSVNEDVGNICKTVLELETTPAACSNIPDESDSGKFE